MIARLLPDLLQTFAGPASLRIILRAVIVIGFLIVASIANKTKPAGA
jgi:hypothetical protein